MDRHLYNFNLNHFALFNRLGLDVRYRYSGLWPDLFFAYQSNYLFVGNDVFQEKAVQGNSAVRKLFHLLSFTLRVPFLYLRSRHFISLTYFYSWNKIDIYNSRNRFAQLKYQLSSFRLGYRFSNTRQYPLSISAEHGRQFQFQTSVVHQALGATQRIYSFSSSYSEFLPFFFKNHVFLLSARGGASFDVSSSLISPFQLGRFGFPKIRGYSALLGNYALSFTLEYRLPIWHIEWGYGNIPFFFRSVYLYIFFDYGNVWNQNSVPFSKFRKSLGAELYFSFTLGYYIDIVAFVGYGYGFDSLGTHDIYFGIGAPLIENFLNRNTLE